MILTAGVQGRKGYRVRTRLAVAVLEAGLAGHLGLVDLNDQVANDRGIFAGAVNTIAHFGGTGRRSHVITHSHRGGTRQLLIVENRNGSYAFHISRQQSDHGIGTLCTSRKGEAASRRSIAGTKGHAFNVGIQCASRQLDVHRGFAFLHSRDIKVLRGGQRTGLIMQHLGVVQQGKEIQIRLVRSIGDLNGLGRINGSLRQAGPTIIDINLFAVNRKAGLGGVLQSGTLAVRTLERYIGDVNNVAARLLQQLGSDRLIPPSLSQTVIL